MDSVINEVMNNLYVYILIFARISGIFVVSPIFGRKSLPNIFKLGVCLILAFLLLPTFSKISFSNISTENFIFLFAKELLAGILMGYVGYFILSAISIAGSIIDFEIGFSMVTAIDPQTEASSSITGSYMYIFATVIFLIMNGHHLIIRLLSESFDILPLGAELHFEKNFLILVMKIMNYILLMGVKLAIPIMLSLFLVTLVLGFLARTMPQMNVFIVGMPLKIIVGLSFLRVIFPSYIPQIQILTKDIYQYTQYLIKILAG